MGVQIAIIHKTFQNQIKTTKKGKITWENMKTKQKMDLKVKLWVCACENRT